MRLILALFCNQFLFYVDNIFGVKKKIIKTIRPLFKLRLAKLGLYSIYSPSNPQMNE